MGVKDPADFGVGAMLTLAVRPGHWFGRPTDARAWLIRTGVLSESVDARDLQTHFPAVRGPRLRIEPERRAAIEQAVRL